jgi:hypothetical protein
VLPCNLPAARGRSLAVAAGEGFRRQTYDVSGINRLNSRTMHFSRHGGFTMQLPPRTSPETDCCLDLIHHLAAVQIHELHVSVETDRVVLTGRTASWYGKQVATTAARRMYPDCRIDNRLLVTTVR